MIYWANTRLFLAQRQMLKRWKKFSEADQKGILMETENVFTDVYFLCAYKPKTEHKKIIAIYLRHAGKRFTIRSSLVSGKNHYDE